MNALGFITRRNGETFDPDIALISDFLAGEMTDAELSAVEDRLASDVEFRRKVMPLIKIWNMPVHLGDPVAPREPWWTRALDTVVEMLRGLLAFPTRSGSLDRRHLRMALGMATLVFVVLFPHVLMRPVSWATKSRVEHREWLLRSQGRAPLAAIADPVTYNAQDAALPVPLPGGSSAVIANGGRVTHQRVADGGRLENIAIDGEVQLQLAGPGDVTVDLSVGRVVLGPGSYVIRSPIRKPEARISVGRSGSLTATWQDASGRRSLQAGAGEHVVLRRNRGASRSTPPLGFPEVR